MRLALPAVTVAIALVVAWPGIRFLFYVAASIAAIQP